MNDFRRDAMDRRRFLATMSALGAGMLLPEHLFGAQAGTAPAGGPIDIHHHYAPPVWVKAAFNSNGGIYRNWTPAGAIEAMDKAGVRTAIQSITTPGVSFGDVAAARKLARECNDYGAKMMADYPGRFGLFAVLPMPDVEGSLREIEYALDVLKADGVCGLSSYGDKWMGDISFAPVYEELNRRKAVMYTHATAANCCEKGMVPNVGVTVIEYGFDTTRAIVGLMVSGLAARTQDVKYIFSHGGGTAPYLLGRFQQAWGDDRAAQHVKEMPDGFLHELSRFYYDTAWAFNPAALAAMTKVTQVSHILYGTDFPYSNLSIVTKGLKESGIFTDAQLRAINRDNALELLPRFRSR